MSDVHVGARLRLRRRMLGISQRDVGKQVGVTYQQVQKYEKGSCRISASCLYKLSHLLEVPVPFFFDKTDPVSPVRAAPVAETFHESFAQAGELELLKRSETIELLQAYYRIEDRSIQRQLLRLVKSLRRRS